MTEKNGRKNNLIHPDKKILAIQKESSYIEVGWNNTEAKNQLIVMKKIGASGRA